MSTGINATSTTAKTRTEIKVELWARNLHNPSHMDWSNDGRLFVSEHSAGRVTDITEGGDMVDAEPFAEGLEGPASMAHLSDDRILISETWGGRVTEITEGGDVSEKEPHAWNLEKPYSLEPVTYDGEERVYVSENRNGLEEWLRDVTAGGEASELEIVVDEFPAIAGAPGNTPLAAGERDGEYENVWEHYAQANCRGSWVSYHEASGRIFVKSASQGQIIEITDARGETYNDLVKDGKVVARGLNDIGGMFVNEDDGLIYGVEPDKGQIFVVDPDDQKNYRFNTPVVQGLKDPTCVRFGPDGGGDEMFVCGRGEGVIWRITDFR